MKILKPSDSFGITVDQSFGSWNFHRSFLRLDSGTLPTNTRLYASYSYTGDDKWNGAGSSYREHASLGLQ